METMIRICESLEKGYGAPGGFDWDVQPLHSRYTKGTYHYLTYELFLLRVI